MNQKLTAVKRETSSRGALQRLRKEGRVPGVIYGKDTEPTAIAVEEKDLQAVLRTNRHAVLELEVSGIGSKNVLISEVQTGALSREVLHVDFHQINMNEKIKAPVRLEVSGKSAGEKEGGMMQLLLHELEVESLPKDLPDHIVLEVGNLEMGDSLTVADLKLPPGVKALHDPDTVVATVLAPQKESEDDQPNAAEGQENQVQTAQKTE